ncbi:MAG: hypothetical protein ACK5KP_11185 [Paludibacteraceae bacterium]
MQTIEIIKQITADKTKQKRHPTHALFYEVLRIAESYYPVSAKEIIQADIKELEKDGIIETGPTQNDTYIRLT